MKHVVLISPFLDEAHAVGVMFRRGEPVPVTDEQAEVLLANSAFAEATTQSAAIADASCSDPVIAPEHQGEKE